MKVRTEVATLIQSDFLSSILQSQVRVLRVVRAGAASQDLTLQQFSVLRFLSQRGAVPMNALCEELTVSAPVVTGIVDRLETKGLVKRKESSLDRRRIEIVITDDGSRAYRRVREGYREPLQEALTRSLKPSEQKILAKLFERFSREIPVQQKFYEHPKSVA